MSEEQINQGRRRFLVTATSVIGGIGVAASAIPFVSAWLPSAKAQAAGAPVEVDVSKLEAGALMIVPWRGKPVWIVRRTQEMLNTLGTDEGELRDPESLVDQQPPYAKNRFRSIKPEYLVLVGICTHLSCSPLFRPVLGELDPTWPGGFYCPCHGSRFDLAGRVFKGVPAPINLEVPPYNYLSEYVIEIGVNA